jgi:hypothetical protein
MRLFGSCNENYPASCGSGSVMITLINSLPELYFVFLMVCVYIGMSHREGIILHLSSYSQSNPIGLKSNRKSIAFEGYRFELLDFFVKGPKSIVFAGDCAYQCRKSNRTAIGSSFMNSNSVHWHDTLWIQSPDHWRKNSAPPITRTFGDQCHCVLKRFTILAKC